MDVDRLSTALADRYRIERELGRGGMAVVFLARDLRHDRQVAVKVLRPELSQSLGEDRFLREIGIESRFQHPHILPLYESGTAAGLLFYVMPFVEGESLRARLIREPQLPVEEALQIVREVAGALSYAHSRGVVHRDIKPENILLSGGHAVVADFGIARAISQAAGEGITDTGMAIGTPAYMSPEQAGGEARLDGRSDLYSLGCVAYEMLVGEPPFTGPTPHAILARHMQERPPSLRVVRPAVPEALEQCIDRLLEKTPADRYETAGAFLAALDLVQSGQTTVSSGRRQWPVRLAAAGVLVGGVTWLVASGVFGSIELDADRYVVLPFDHREGAVPTVLDGAQSQWRLAEALREWEGVSTVDNFQLEDARLRRGGFQLGHRDWLEVSRRLAAGKMVRGEIAEFADTVYLTATSFDVAADGGVLKQVSDTIPLRDGDPVAAFRRMAASLLGMEHSAGVSGVGSTRSLLAGREYAAAQNAIAEGRFAEARAGFARATQHDANFADAHFWLAQVMAWQGREESSWSFGAQRAVDLQARLSDPLAQKAAAPLLDLARGRFDAACGGYADEIAKDSANFVAWLGLGECQSRDDVVLPDASSPSGWRFQSSYEVAMDAFRRGLAIAPAFTGSFFFRLARRVLFVDPNLVRLGFAHGSDSVSFWAFPVLSSDTLVFVPYPAADVQAAVPGSGHEAALAHNREALREITDSWAQAYPNSAEAQAAVAQTLEDLAREERGPSALRSALRHVRRARALEGGEDLRLRLGHVQTRILVKLGEFAQARDLADSLLDSMAGPTHGTRLAGLAVLIGRPTLAAAILARRIGWMRRSAIRRWRFEDVPLPVMEDRERLRAYASLGFPRDSLDNVTARVDSLLRLWTGAAAASRVEAELLAEPMMLAFPYLGRSVAHRAGARDYLIQMQILETEGDSAALRTRIEQLVRLRADDRPHDVEISRAYPEMLLQLSLGDTAGVVERLDLLLGVLSGFDRRVLTDAPNPAALMRAMILRAELADRRGDSTTAGRWAGAVMTLWQRAESALDSVVARLRQIAGPDR